MVILASAWVEFTLVEVFLVEITKKMQVITFKNIAKGTTDPRIEFILAK